MFGLVNVQQGKFIFGSNNESELKKLAGENTNLKVLPFREIVQEYSIYNIQKKGEVLNV